MKWEEKINKKLVKRFDGKISMKVDEDCIRVTGECANWEHVVEACKMCTNPKSGLFVVNDISFTGGKDKPIHLPIITDKSLEGRRPDVLVIGGGVSGASILRELTKWDVDAILIEKEADLALQASGRNDGEVHPGVDLSMGTVKQSYVKKGNEMFDKLCLDLEVPFRRCGQYVGFTDPKLYPLVQAFARNRRRKCGIEDSRVVSRKWLLDHEPNMNPEFAFALYNKSAGSVSPYQLTIAYGENAVQNGGEVHLNTALLSMEVQGGHISSVKTNRGVLYPKVVINAAGVFAEDVAKMAEDRFYSIHPRRGTNSILDRKATPLLNTIASVKELFKSTANSKGGGMVHTAHEVLLVGPDAVETYEKENVATTKESIEKVFNKQKKTVPKLREKDIITYFTGVRAPTFEEDFVIERGRKTENIIHCAGIQSPGLTTAPAVALDISKIAVELLEKDEPIKENPSFNPKRQGIPDIKNMAPEERNKLIKENPDYGVIICRCEEISKGEILDAIRSDIPVPTVDGVKKRVRPGMGRCQGGFCLPLVTQIISEELNCPLSEVKRTGEGSNITVGSTKGDRNE